MEVTTGTVQDYEVAAMLSGALERDEVTLVYQPVVDVFDHRLVAVEALCRWSTAELGTIAPDVFIGVAERFDLIAELGSWVLRRAASDIDSISSAAGRPIRVAVNVSPRELLDPTYTLAAASVLAEALLDPSQLELEITEGESLSDASRVSDDVAGLRALGLTVALDDFGTGYANLDVLSRVAVDAVKIDRSFVSGDRDAYVRDLLTRQIIDLGERLGLRVVGEGVETRAQLDALRAAGCREVQGYYFSPAVGVESYTPDFVARVERLSH